MFVLCCFFTNVLINEMKMTEFCIKTTSLLYYIHFIRTICLIRHVYCNSSPPQHLTREGGVTWHYVTETPCLFHGDTLLWCLPSPDGLEAAGVTALTNTSVCRRGRADSLAGVHQECLICWRTTARHAHTCPCFRNPWWHFTCHLRFSSMCEGAVNTSAHDVFSPLRVRFFGSPIPFTNVNSSFCSTPRCAWGH